MSIDQLVAKLQKLSTQVEKGMSKHGFTVWIQMIRQDLFTISNAEVRKGALKLLGVVETAGFCLDKVPEARESLILPNLKPLIEFLTNNVGGVKKKTAKQPKAEPEKVPQVPEVVPQVKVEIAKQIDEGSKGGGPIGPINWTFSNPMVAEVPVEEAPLEWGFNPS